VSERKPLNSRASSTPEIIYYYNKTCLEWNLKGSEHFSAEVRFPFNQGIL
jgi:hypothetical protein